MNCGGGKVLNPDTKTCECPEKLFWNGYQCIECYHPKYFDTVTMQCLNCPAGQTYNLQLKQCVDCPYATPYFNGDACVACPSDQVFNS